MLVSYLTSLTELSYFNIRAAAVKNGEDWVYSDTALGSQDSKYLDAPSMQALSYDTPGPLFTTIYPHDGTENDSLAVGVSIRSDGGQDYRLVLLFDATALMERID